jgi:hypothetical protein
MYFALSMECNFTNASVEGHHLQCLLHYISVDMLRVLPNGSFFLGNGSLFHNIGSSISKPAYSIKIFMFKN